MLARILYFMAAALLGLGGCREDRCRELDTQAQIGVTLLGLSAPPVQRTRVTLTINAGAALTRVFNKAEPTFVLEFMDRDRDPRRLVVEAASLDSAGKKVGYGRLETEFSSDGCNFFTVTSRPLTRDAGVTEASSDALTDAVHIPTAKWVTVPSGTFTMGSPTSEPCRVNDENRHQVVVTRPFQIQDSEVTQKQFASVMGYTPSHATACKDAACPVSQVTWHEAVAYCQRLSLGVGSPACYEVAGSGSA